MKDKNGIELAIGMNVNVPEPIKGHPFYDTHNNEFSGTIIGFHGGYVTVRDADDECFDGFDVEPERLTIEITL